MWGLVYTALSFLASPHPRGVRRISAISCLDLSTTGKSDFLLPVFTIFPHYCPIFLYIAHYSHSALLARQLYRGQEIVRTGKNFEKNHSPSPLTQPYIKSPASLLSLSKAFKQICTAKSSFHIASNVYMQNAYPTMLYTSPQSIQSNLLIAPPCYIHLR